MKRWLHISVMTLEQAGSCISRPRMLANWFEDELVVVSTFAIRMADYSLFTSQYRQGKYVAGLNCSLGACWHFTEGDNCTPSNWHDLPLNFSLSSIYFGFSSLSSPGAIWSELFFDFSFFLSVWPPRIILFVPNGWKFSVLKIKYGGLTLFGSCWSEASHSRGKLRLIISNHVIEG